MNVPSFNVARSSYFKMQLKRLLILARGMFPLGSETLRTTPLEKQRKECPNRWLILKSLGDIGCPILSDGWSDSCQSAIDKCFLFLLPSRGIFLKAMDAMNEVKTSEYISAFWMKHSRSWGENWVQVVTDNASNCVWCRKVDYGEYRTIYWTPCAAHCLDLCYMI